MARKHLLAAPLNRSSLVSVVEFSARKLIIFVLVQLVLSPFILITADSLSGSMNNNGTPALDSGQRFGVASNITVNRIKTECTGAVTFLTNTTAEMVVNVTAKSANGNSISEQSEIVANGGRPYDVNLSLTGNASINNQSEGRIMASDSERMNQQNGHFNKSNERVLSRKRRYLIFPPGSSIQIGESHFIYAWKTRSSSFNFVSSLLFSFLQSATYSGMCFAFYLFWFLI